MIATKKSFFKKIGAGLMVLAAMTPIALGMTSMKSVSADTKTEDKFTISLHKMIRNSDTAEDIESDGTDKGPINGYENYDKSKDGNVEFSIFNVEEAFEKWKGAQDEPYNDDGAAFNAFQQELISKFSKDDNGKDLTVDQILEAQKTYLASNELTALQTINTDTEGWSGNTFNFSKEGITNSGKYLILETYANSTQVSSISAPLVFNLPLKGHTNSSKIHLYAKNTVPKTDPELEKEMQDPEDTTNFITKAGVKFTLSGTNGDVEGVTNENGTIKFEKLSNGNYSLKETETLPGWDKLEGEVLFKVNNGEITLREGSATWATISTNTNGTIVFKVKNFFTKGGTNFLKIDDSEEKNPLANAKFKIAKDANASQYAELDQSGTNYKFIKWTTKASATEIVTNSTGSFSVSGFPYGTYYIEETEAPDGFGKLTAMKSFDIDETSSSSTTEIVNTKYGLPSTGGMGIWLFVLIGAALMGGSGYYYYKSRKNKLAE
ncbi:LPXTG cell wall anchor domain-containing protein [Pediococcus ethanolidurans]|uniref:SpaA isopeptide-forming pilin-related protein n=1 Tax=Pediococcus ethanolidurans TaxID=319653 RepID=UPI00295475D8|nr:SpaA isopeptide-forming pilin-related protein [Pediococcus ethanolidurans]MDV7719675.1 LPXTG cell wall anchor domain-containing protein [Pediococcus ethanolidurans]